MADQPSTPPKTIRAEVAGNQLEVIVTGDRDLLALEEHEGIATS